MSVYLGFFRIAGQSGSEMASMMKKTLARRCRSLCVLAMLSRTARDVVSGSWLKRVGTGPAATSPSKKSPSSGQAASRIVGTLSLRRWKKDKNFKTTVEIGDESRRSKEEERRQKILNDPYVKEAEKLFNSKIDKIILND